MTRTGSEVKREQEALAGRGGAEMAAVEQTYRRCCEAAEGILHGFELQDLSIIEQHVRLLRQHLAHCRDVEQTRAEGEILWRLEQLDALDGITEDMESCLMAMKTANRSALERMMVTEGLLRHLTASEGEGRRSALPVC